jgi:hypothetical protein
MPAREDPEKERQRLADGLAAAQKQTGTLSRRLSDLEPPRGQFDQRARTA